MLNKPSTEPGATEYGTCLCMPGFLGDFCQQAETCPRDCMGRGMCLAGKCQCRHGYSGADCGQVNLGVNLVRHEGETWDVGVGLRADTGCTVNKEAVKLYFLGWGGEVSFDVGGRPTAFGVSLCLLKWHIRGEPLEGGVELRM